MKKLLVMFMFCSLTICVLSSYMFAQFQAGFQSLIFPRSLTSAGVGEQGVFLKDGLSAMQYNPANLVYTNDFTVSYFKNPWNLIGWAGGLPINSINILFNLGTSGSFGIEYTYWNFGESITSTTTNPNSGEKFHFYERSIASGYAISLSENFAIGAHIRYMWQPYSVNKKVENFLFSGGVSYRPEIFSDRVTVGLSLMNFGNKIQYESGQDTINGIIVRYSSESPLPAQINFGIGASAISNNFFQLDVSFGFKKPLDKITGPPNYSVQSAFKSLFNDWDDFPEDVTVQTGLGFIWHPIYLGAGISFIQEMYLGYFSTGPKDLYNSFYTHGIRMGLSAYGIEATIGYAGRWHNNNASNYIQWDYPWETFQFSLTTNIGLFGIKNKEGLTEERSTKNIILSVGYFVPSTTGKMKERELGGAKISMTTTPLWLIEADFYINEKSAIFTSFDYSRLTHYLSIPTMNPSYRFNIDIGYETFSIESGFKYHPIEIFSPLFVQLSLGIIRLNPVLENTSPRYFYNTYKRVVFGLNIPIFDGGIILIPKCGLRTIFMKEFPNTNLLGGYNLYEVGLNVGYRL